MYQTWILSLKTCCMKSESGMITATTDEKALMMKGKHLTRWNGPYHTVARWVTTRETAGNYLRSGRQNLRKSQEVAIRN